MDDNGSLSGCKVDYLVYNFFTMNQVRQFSNVGIGCSTIDESALRMGFAIYIK